MAHGPGVQAANEARAAENRAKVWELRKTGASFRQIAKQLDISHQRAHQLYLEEAGSYHKQEDVLALRALQLQRLDYARLAIFPRVSSGDLKAVFVWKELEALTAKIGGTLAPTTIKELPPTGADYEFSEEQKRNIARALLSEMSPEAREAFKFAMRPGRALLDGNGNGHKGGNGAK